MPTVDCDYVEKLINYHYIDSLTLSVLLAVCALVSQTQRLSFHPVNHCVAQRN